MKTIHGCLVLVKGEKCDGLYYLIQNIVISVIPLTLKGS